MPCDIGLGWLIENIHARTHTHSTKENKNPDKSGTRCVRCMKRGSNKCIKYVMDFYRYQFESSIKNHIFLIHEAYELTSIFRSAKWIFSHIDFTCSSFTFSVSFPQLSLCFWADHRKSNIKSNRLMGIYVFFCSIDLCVRETTQICVEIILFPCCCWHH